MRLDQWLFEQAYFESREKARRAIVAGKVRQARSGELLDKPGQKVPKNLEVQIELGSPYVGRGAEKLAGFLNEAGISLEAKAILDVGASTGGFTDCALQRGARSALCVDVGSHQLHEKIRSDSRVEFYENQDIREFKHPSLSEVDWVFVDCSFISLRKIIPSLLNEVSQAQWILLFKPQFELGKEVAIPGGIVREGDRVRALHEMLLFLDSMGLNPRMLRPSQVKGTKGNQESFLWIDPQAASSKELQMFRTYDVRGRSPELLSPLRMKQIGKALLGRIVASAPKKKKWKVGVGRDNRPSSPFLAEALLEALRMDSRFEVEYLHEVSTPTLYFASKDRKWDAAFQVTASHNPKEDNGLKMLIGGQALFGAEIRGLGLEVLASPELPLEGLDWEDYPSLQADAERAYLKYFRDQFSLKKKFRIAVDCGNGMAGRVARSALEPYASHLEILYETADCRFPNHPADPTVAKNLKELQKLIQGGDFDVGFAFDGDGDRVGVLTRRGRILWGDEILMLLAEKVLKDQPGATVIGEVKCSQKLFQMIKARGGKAIMYKTGHSLMKQKLKELGAPLAGEMSGHLFFGDRFFGFDDGLYAALRVLEVMEELDLDLDDWIESFPSMQNTPEIRVACAEEEKLANMEKIKAYFRKKAEGELNEIDGVRVSFSDGSWILARPSNTEAVLVFRIEAPTEERLELLRAELETLMGVAIRV